MAVAGCTGLGGWSTGGEGGLTAGWMVVGLGTPVSVSGCSLSGVGLQELGSSGCPSPITGLGGGGDLVMFFRGGLVAYGRSSMMVRRGGGLCTGMYCRRNFLLRTVTLPDPFKRMTY